MHNPCYLHIYIVLVWRGIRSLSCLFKTGRKALHLLACDSVLQQDEYSWYGEQHVPHPQETMMAYRCVMNSLQTFAPFAAQICPRTNMYTCL